MQALHMVTDCGAPKSKKTTHVRLSFLRAGSLHLTLGSIQVQPLHLQGPALLLSKGINEYVRSQVVHWHTTLVSMMIQRGGSERESMREGEREGEWEGAKREQVSGGKRKCERKREGGREQGEDTREGTEGIEMK